ncbi:hypothetical protein [Bacillus cereus]|uniref:hypothetical protein n=1 Tax=Bacillus cereus TaxID=1396 RepID=UPI000279E480|nr:hypothetical protein [Bacillus cereus]EJR95295.1 hypothetical protein IKG_03836 [Bacillus cereus VD200]
MTGSWRRSVPKLVQENIKIKRREYKDFDITGTWPNSNICRIIDVEWFSKDDVPICISFKKSEYDLNDDMTATFHKIRVCLFNVSDKRDATVTLYKIEEFFG